MFDRQCLEANLAVLAQHHPELAERLKQIDPSPYEDGLDDLDALSGRKGLPTLKARDQQGEFFLHSPYDPVREAETWVDAQCQELKPGDVAVVIGFGLAYALEAAIERQETKRIVVVEPSAEALLLALGVRDFSGLLASPSLQLVVYDEPSEAARATAKLLHSRQFYGWKPWIHPAMARHYLAFSREYAKQLSTLLTAFRTVRITNYAKSRLFMENAIANLALMAASPGVDHFRGRWANRPLVLVAAGPSLDQHLEMLKCYQHRILILAVGQAWRSLRNAGIEPHMVVSVDPNPANIPHFKGVASRGAWLVADSVCHPKVTRGFGGARVFGHATPDNELLFSNLCGPRGELLSGGSVANSAFSFALTLQASPVILIGQDLAFTGGRTHATGNAFQEELGDSISEQPGMRPVPGYFGEPVYTNSQMDTYRHWFEKKLLEVGEDVRVINATEGGARIAHAEQMPFAEAMEQFAMVDELNVSSLWPAENEDWPRSFDQVRARVKQLQRQLSHIAGKADRIAATAAQLPEHKDTRQYRKLTRQIKDEGQKLYRRKDRAWVILGAFLAKQSFGVKHRAQLREDGETEEDFSPVAVAYYQSIAAASREASRRLKTALDVECERECGASETG